MWTDLINLLLTECNGCSGEYWPEVAAVQTKCSEVQTILLNRLKQARLLSSLVHGNQTKHVSFEYASFHNQNTWLMTVPVETVHMTNYGLSKNPSEHLDLPQEYLDI